jgi:hypothetical protein
VEKRHLFSNQIEFFMIEFLEYFKQTVKKIYLKYKYWNGIKFEYYKK